MLFKKEVLIVLFLNSSDFSCQPQKYLLNYTLKMGLNLV